MADDRYGSRVFYYDLIMEGTGEVAFYGEKLHLCGSCIF